MGKYIVCELEDESYAVAVESVQSIEYLRPITRVPGTRPFVKGVMNLRGIIMAVLDLGVMLGKEAKEPTKETRVIVVHTSNGLEVGWIVDSANNVREFEEDSILPADDGAGSHLSGLVKLENQVVAILDVDSLLEESDRT